MPRSPLFLTRKFPPSVGGMETLAAGVWRSLAAARPDARLIAFGRGNRELVWWLPWSLLRLIGQLARRRVSLVLTGDALMFALAEPILRLFRVRSATMIMGLDVTFENRVYRAIVHPALRRAPAVLAISAATAEQAIEFGVARERTTVIRLGVTAPTVTPPDRIRARVALHDRLGLTAEDRVLLTLGRLVRRKGGAWFCAAVLPELPDDVHYVIAGDGPEAAAIRAEVARAGLQSRVHLLGRVEDDERETLLCGADLFVQPNIAVEGDMEGFGLVTIEAAMRGLPVLAADLEGIKDAVVDGSTGLLLASGDGPAWVQRLRELLADPDGLGPMGARFQQATIERYGEAAMGAQLVATLGLA